MLRLQLHGKQLVNMNTTTNRSLCPVTQPPTTFQMAVTVAYSLIYVASIFGNFCLIIVVFKTQALKKTINFLIVNMAISDLLIKINTNTVASSSITSKFLAIRK